MRDSEKISAEDYHANNEIVQAIGETEKLPLVIGEDDSTAFCIIKFFLFDYREINSLIISMIFSIPLVSFIYSNYLGLGLTNYCRKSVKACYLA